MENSGQERREHPRIIFPCKISIGYPYKTIDSYTENISEKGVKVVLDTRLQDRCIVNLVLFLQKGNPTICKGSVVWVMEQVNAAGGKLETLYHTGITFTEIATEDRQRIKKIVDSKLKKKGDENPK